MTDPYVPLTGPPAWRNAACRGEDPELWFPLGTTGPALLQIHEAKTICRRCPHAAECAAWADHVDARYGIWGGLDPEQRARARRRQQRQAQQATQLAARRRETLDDAITGWSR